MQRNPVGWFEIFVQDMPRARSFYETVFEVKLTDLAMPGMDEWMFPGVDDGKGTTGALVKMEGCPSGGNSTLVYFTCEDCAVNAARAVAAGGVLVREKFSIGPYGFVALVSDTEGNLIGLHSQK
ncbi:MAG: lactoylglutathione lyase [Deltaproteobacteria bacterium HGW-Deltaproteobacteria-17]|nr:MAG: lactoylglutathione lyase [Deltaproteobacteria bacterium HGW-Deltaproteobacteria-17]